MAKRSAHDPTVQNRIKIGSPRTTKRKKGNAPARTSRSGSGKRVR